MRGRVIGVILMAFGVGVLALAAADFLGWGIDLDGSTPALAMGAILLGLGWMKYGEKGAAERLARPPSISDNNRKRP